MPNEPITTADLRCECCPWSGPESSLADDFTCPKCGENVWSDQTQTTAFDEFWEGIWWVPDGAGKVRNATPGECAAEIKRLRTVLFTIEQMANEGRDDAIDNRGHVIELYEANQFEQIGAFARGAQNVE